MMALVVGGMRRVEKLFLKLKSLNWRGKGGYD